MQPMRVLVDFIKSSRFGILTESGALIGVIKMVWEEDLDPSKPNLAIYRGVKKEADPAISTNFTLVILGKNAEAVKAWQVCSDRCDNIPFVQLDSNENEVLVEKWLCHGVTFKDLDVSTLNVQIAPKVSV